MYPVNAPSLQALQSMFLAAGRRRTGQQLLGAKDGVNRMFMLPNDERFVNLLPMSTISVFLNGLRLSPVDDYLPIEGLGVGTGFNRIEMTIALLPGDYLLADYLIP